MSKEAIVEKIIQDAENEARQIVDVAEQKAQSMLDAAKADAAEQMARAKEAAEQKAKSIAERKAAAARLAGAKIQLAEKHSVIDELYARALDTLCAMKGEQALAFTQQLLTQYAEKGDEIVFANNYPCVEEAKALPVVTKMKLTVSDERADIDGGFLLVGKKSDKDLSFGALLQADREEHAAALAEELFN